MEAGRELDQLVAERVLGRTKTEAPSRICDCGFDPCIKGYSTEIAIAWQVVEFLSPTLRLELIPIADGSRVAWQAQFIRYTPGNEFSPWVGGYSMVALTVPHVICLAALRAVEQWGMRYK